MFFEICKIDNNCEFLYLANLHEFKHEFLDFTNFHEFGHKLHE